MAWTRSAVASRSLGVLLAVLAGLFALPVCVVTGLAAANQYQPSWPIAFTIAYYAVGAAWLMLVLTAVGGRVAFIVVSFLALLALLGALAAFTSFARLT